MHILKKTVKGILRYEIFAETFMPCYKMHYQEKEGVNSF